MSLYANSGESIFSFHLCLLYAIIQHEIFFTTLFFFFWGGGGGGGGGGDE
jgi:hypothetical protein